MATQSGKWGAGWLSPDAEARFAAGVEACGRFLMGESEAHRARFIELKLASGMVAAHRAKDLVDVQELIKSAKLSRDVALTLDPWVREKFLELWELAQRSDPF